MSYTRLARAGAAWAVILAALCAGASAQDASFHEIEMRTERLAFDSGPVPSLRGAERAVFQTTVHVDDAPWLRLFFSEVTLAPGSFVRVTSAKDGHTQDLNAAALQTWGNSSAYFNGGTLLVEIVASRAGVNRLVISELQIGEEPGMIDTICGPTDDRVVSNDPRQGRALPIGCTAWMITDCAHCFITAGHCTTTSLQVIEFNVPLSLPNGSLQHPPPSDQYSVDATSRQGVNGGIGNDWGYFGVLRNTTTGQTPFEHMGGGAYTVAATAPAVAGQTLRITGYGTTSPANTLNQAQKTHTGTYNALSGNTIQHRVDTTGGNSGSPIVDLVTGLAIGIHTHAGCTSTGGVNSGTNVGIAGLRSALLNPLGICNQTLPGDVNGDHHVDFADLNRILSDFGLTGAPGFIPSDVNRDGVVNFADLNICLGNWDATC